MNHLPAIEHIEKDGFRLRGTHMSRVDGFSDVVFGFALTLLVVSLEVPKTYSELHQSLRGFIPFAVCFYFLLIVWYAHYKFFRRFGLHDVTTISLNATLLFVVLFFVYPLKFLFTFLVLGLLGDGHAYFETFHQVTELMLIYGGGFAAVHLLQAALYWNGYRQREHLQLNAHETMLTITYIAEDCADAGVGLLSCLIAVLLPDRNSGYAGFAYMLIAVYKPIYGQITRRRVKKYRAEQKVLKTPRGV